MVKIVHPEFRKKGFYLLGNSHAENKNHAAQTVCKLVPCLNIVQTM
jgi:hypothetical protein